MGVKKVARGLKKLPVPRRPPSYSLALALIGIGVGVASLINPPLFNGIGRTIALVAAALLIISGALLAGARSIAGEDKNKTAQQNKIGPAVIRADPPTANTFESLRARTGGSGNMRPIGVRVLTLPIYNDAELLGEEDLHGVVASIKLMPQDGGQAQLSHGRWRELEVAPISDTSVQAGLARSAVFSADGQRHLLDVLICQEDGAPELLGWKLAADPSEASLFNGVLPPGQYILTVTLRSPDLEGSAKLDYQLLIPDADQIIGHGPPGTPRLIPMTR
jgi:hypothetical protein